MRLSSGVMLRCFRIVTMFSLLAKALVNRVATTKAEIASDSSFIIPRSPWFNVLMPKHHNIVGHQGMIGRNWFPLRNIMTTHKAEGNEGTGSPPCGSFALLLAYRLWDYLGPMLVPIGKSSNSMWQNICSYTYDLLISILLRVRTWPTPSIWSNGRSNKSTPHDEASTTCTVINISRIPRPQAFLFFRWMSIRSISGIRDSRWQLNATAVKTKCFADAAPPRLTPHLKERVWSCDGRQLSLCRLEASDDFFAKP